MKVAVIDDTLSNILLLKELLGRIEGCEPFCFTDPREAMSWCEREEPDLVLVDYMMPEMDGIEFIQQFRTLAGKSATPIVIVTAYSEKDILYRALSAGANDFVTKPVDKKELISRISNLLALKSRQNELAARADTLGRQMDALAAEVRKMHRDRELMQSELVHVQKIGAIGQLTSGIAHDFNNTLTAIISYGNIIKCRLDGRDSLHDCADKLLASTDRASKLAKSLLSFSRKQTLEVKAVDLNGIVGDCAMFLLRPVCREVKISLSLSKNPIQVMVDVSQIEQVLVNLTVNARDAMQNGGTLMIQTGVVQLQDRSPHGEAQKLYGVITVQDTGTGMDEDTKDRIFEPFFTTKKQGKGTGLGLSIVYDIVRKFGGKMEVDSEIGKGTTFRIFLPIVLLPKAAAPAQETL